ncbi:lytic transglycosylase domain-containing protein [Stenotrophomonas sp. MMGLT7]|uniref:lytic transglycosylase domain-containing protein n=1 Tax=Stenotrophomonas sp. MMGLT7 TaxID=2901227 RepID=UPI001E38820A|nr:lytic transglycosylase domain-containing protein [Stenotrophomonas sp. MMGLT7]MCD7099763.1 transglycosylase SLT domain-containing protein [Stenotrophomonas sp. MMGLT7]
MRRALLSLSLGLVLGLASPPTPATARPADTTTAPGNPHALPIDPASLPQEGTRNGRTIFARFRSGLADGTCDDEATSERWRRHFSHAPAKLADQDGDVLPLFGYVVDQLRDAGLPTEFALIPFVESGYRPAARNGSGPAGLWQFVTATARNHNVPIENGYDGRLSAVESTRAATRYLKTLYGMFGGDWRLAIMAYNAGEYRVLQSIRRAGMNAGNADPSSLPGLSPVTYQYVEKLHALTCVLEEAEQQGSLLAALDRPVPMLSAHTLPGDGSLQDWAARRALPTDQVARLNPALSASGKQAAAGRPVLAPMHDVAVAQASPAPVAVASVAPAADAAPRAASRPARASARTHTVRNGESAWSIARRYGVTVQTLLTGNGLSPRSVLKPGMVLRFEGEQ